MKFSIVTPSFRSSKWLKLCIASVADQEGVEWEHIVQDSCSDDGTLDWLPRDPRVRAFIEKDAGMYDAVNRGFRRAQGDILAYLNCDEQYLPGALKAAHDFFEQHPEIDVMFAGSIVTDSEGKYICHRHALIPHPRYAWLRFSVLTSSTFVRRKVVHERGLFFDATWRVIGDLHWVLAVMKAGVPVAVCDSFTSAFTDTGDNLCLGSSFKGEFERTMTMIPRWVKILKPLWIAHHRLRRIAAKHFNLKPSSYSIYTLQSPERRVQFFVPNPTGVWRTRM